MKQRQCARVTSVFLMMLMLASLVITPVCAKSPSPPEAQNVDAACVMNAEYKKAVIDKDMTKVVYPASTVKLMTALVAAEHFANDLEASVTVTEDAEPV